MPVQPTYPGVYIEEIPSGVHTITGVATSITAFIGRAARGPGNKAITIESFADFERIFGGLWLDSSLGYAVKDFYLNGGNQAVIVRLYSPFFATLADMQAARSAAQGVFAAASAAAAVAGATGNDVAVAARKNVTDNNFPAGPELTASELLAVRAEQTAKNGGDAPAVMQAVKDAVDVAAPVTRAQFLVGGLPFVAAYEGTWGENLRASIDFNVSADAAKNAGLQKADLFNLTVTDTASGRTETYRNLTLKDSSLRVDKVLEDQSRLIRWAGTVPPKEALPPPSAIPITDAVSAAETALSNARKKSSYDKTKRANAFIASQQSNITAANKVLADANTKLDAAKNAKPPVPADITAAQKAVDDAKKALADAQPAAVANKALADAKTKLDTAKNAKPPVPADIAAAQKAVDDAQAIVDALGVSDDISTQQNALGSQRAAFTASDGNQISVNEFVGTGLEARKWGLFALEQVDLFNLLCIPPYKDLDNGYGGDIDVDLVSEAAAYCEKRRAMLLVDPPSDWIDISSAVDKFTEAAIDNVGTRSKNAAIFFPRLKQPNILHNNQVETFVPCGVMAGIFARTDAQRGVWKAPAGLEASLVGVPQLSVNLTDAENGELNPLGVNCLRAFPIYGRVAWGSRTLRGADQFADEYKYIPVRRTALFIEESLYRGTQWVVFEPNDEPLWAQIRLNVGAFMHNLFRQGAFQGQTPRDAYLVKCDSETTTQNDINLGIVNILVAFAPLKPAEFVIIQIQQLAGQIAV